jgi:hypothetical protein
MQALIACIFFINQDYEYIRIDRWQGLHGMIPGWFELHDMEWK